MRRGRSQGKLLVSLSNINLSKVTLKSKQEQFYNAVLFMGSVAIFSLIAQKMNAGR